MSKEKEEASMDLSLASSSSSLTKVEMEEQILKKKVEMQKQIQEEEPCTDLLSSLTKVEMEEQILKEKVEMQKQILKEKEEAYLSSQVEMEEQILRMLSEAVEAARTINLRHQKQHQEKEGTIEDSPPPNLKRVNPWDQIPSGSSPEHKLRRKEGGSPTRMDRLSQRRDRLSHRKQMMTRLKEELLQLQVHRHGSDIWLLLFQGTPSVDILEEILLKKEEKIVQKEDLGLPPSMDILQQNSEIEGYSQLLFLTLPCLIDSLKDIQKEQDDELTKSVQDDDDDERSEAYEEEEEERREAYEEERKDSFKRVLKSVQAHSHPDIRCKPNRKFPDPDSADFEQKMKRLQERVALPHDENQCEDGFEDSDTDEEILVPSKKNWLGICMGIWGMEDAAAVISQVKATEQVFEIYTDGLYNENGDSGCGAILHDFPHRPIAARSKVIAKEKCGSPFILHLEGVALGVKLAMQYDAFPFYLYCPSESVCYFVDQNWLRKDKCRCSGGWETVKRRCKVCSKRLMFTRNHKDHEVAFELTEDIFSDVSELEKRGLPFFTTCDGRNENNEKNEAAYYLASLLQDKEYKLKEIGEGKELWDIIYREAFGLFFE